MPDIVTLQNLVAEGWDPGYVGMKTSIKKNETTQAHEWNKPEWISDPTGEDARLQVGWAGGTRRWLYAYFSPEDGPGCQVSYSSFGMPSVPLLENPTRMEVLALMSFFKLYPGNSYGQS